MTEERITARIDPRFRAAIEDLVRRGEYASVDQFVDLAVRLRLERIRSPSRASRRGWTRSWSTSSRRGDGPCSGSSWTRRWAAELSQRPRRAGAGYPPQPRWGKRIAANEPLSAFDYNGNGRIDNVRE